MLIAICIAPTIASEKEQPKINKQQIENNCVPVPQPIEPLVPFPQPDETNVNIDRESIVWYTGHEGCLAIQCFMYFGTDKSNIPLQHTIDWYHPRFSKYLIITGVNFDDAGITLEYGTTYYWYVKVVDENDGTVNGPVWSFTTEISPGDLDGNFDIDYNDFLMFTSSFGRSENDPQYNPDCDYDNDGVITFIDYQMWFQYYRDYNQ